MEAVIPILCALLAGCVIVLIAIRALGRRSARQGRAQVQALRNTPWTVTEIAGRRSVCGSTTQILVVRMTEDGTILDRIVVAAVPHDAPDWQEKIMAGRDEAGSRAAVLNARP